LTEALCEILNPEAKKICVICFKEYDKNDASTVSFGTPNGFEPSSNMDKTSTTTCVLLGL